MFEEGLEVDWISRWAVSHPDRIALRDVDRGVLRTYAALSRVADRLAGHLLRDHGVVQGDRVAFLGEGSHLAFEVQFACFRVGAVFVPLNWRLTEGELGGILGDAAPALLCVDAPFAELAQALSRGHGPTPLPLLPLEDAQGAPRFDDPGPGAHPPALPPQHPAMEDLAQILFTSGTTGRPKGAMIPHRQLLFNALNTAQACGLTHRDKTLAFLPLFHTGGLNCLAMPLLYLGGEVVVTRRFEAPRAIALMDALGITCVIAVPTMYQMLLEAGLPGSAELPALRQLLCGGAPCPETLLQTYWGKGYALRQGFGMTEVGPNCFALGPSAPGPKAASVGPPAFFAAARVVNSEGQPLGDGAVGELQLAGPHVCLGYWGRPEATAESRVGQWFSTGDLARRDPDGYYYVVGRKKEMFISGGENVYPAEIEGILASHPGVLEACVVGIPHERWGEVGLALVEGRPGVALDPEEIRHFVGQNLARYKVPRVVLVVDALPRNAAGKVLKDGARRAYLERLEEAGP